MGQWATEQSARQILIAGSTGSALRVVVLPIFTSRRSSGVKGHQVLRRVLNVRFASKATGLLRRR
jgi:hypothetical protein